MCAQWKKPGVPAGNIKHACGKYQATPENVVRIYPNATSRDD
jgi:hypothetical protein